MTKKSYNPFKMWGSWIGVIIGLILHTFIAHEGNFLELFTLGTHAINGTLFTVGGFLIGWGIHSLVRARRK